MDLPNPIPDNPLRWDGWKNYNSENPYERLCLAFDANPGSAQIEDHSRRLLAWWQKKLPLKNQPSNPIAQLLRSGMDDAPVKLAEARMLLLDPAARAEIDSKLVTAAKEAGFDEFSKFLSFALTSGDFGHEAEDNLYHLGEGLGLARPEMKLFIDKELHRLGMKRAARPVHGLEAPVPQPVEVAPPPALAVPVMAQAKASPREEFLRMLRLSGIDEMTDDQRDAFCNMGEALGMSGGESEDIIDEYLEERSTGEAAESEDRPEPAERPGTTKVAAPQKLVEMPVARLAAKPAIVNSPARRAEEKQALPNFINSIEMPMLLVTSGVFEMGSAAPGAAPNEQPVSKVGISAFFLSRWPVTNAQYEEFDPAHRAKRIASANDSHPVVYVSAQEAARFCQWLSAREKRHYRLPSEAEWEYAARGLDGRIFPWGANLDRGDLANFADVNKKLPWASRAINTGFAETSPVGSFPRGISPFGIEDMAGNVWEWCLDCLSAYQGKDRTNPRGSLEGTQRIYRGGSWKSRIGSLRASARNFNSPAFSANDVGFRVLCEAK